MNTQLSIERLEELHEWFDPDDFPQFAEDMGYFCDVQDAIAELIARRRVEVARWRARHDEDHE